MAELFIELFSEEIPSKLQIDARQKILRMINESLDKKEITFKSSKSFSTPKRLTFVVDGIPEKIELKKKVLKGPKVGVPQDALNGFLRSNGLKISEVYKKTLDKGEFYFANIKPQTINILNEFENILPDILKNYSWKKSMKWSTYDLSWGRPLKSIVAIFNCKLISFSFFHIKSSDSIFLDEFDSTKRKKVKDFKSYTKILEKLNIILDHNKREEIILKKFNNICNS